MQPKKLFYVSFISYIKALQFIWTQKKIFWRTFQLFLSIQWKLVGSKTANGFGTTSEWVNDDNFNFWVSNHFKADLTNTAILSLSPCSSLMWLLWSLSHILLSTHTSPALRWWPRLNRTIQSKRDKCASTYSSLSLPHSVHPSSDEIKWKQNKQPIHSAVISVGVSSLRVMGLLPHSSSLFF